jgi:hypothetical protein
MPISRWRTPDRERLAQEVFGRFLAGKPLDELDQVTTKGEWICAGLSRRRRTESVPSTRKLTAELSRTFAEVLET